MKISNKLQLLCYSYDKAIAEGWCLDDVPELQDALHRAYEEIEAMEIENGIDMEDEHAYNQGFSGGFWALLSACPGADDL